MPRHGSAAAGAEVDLDSTPTSTRGRSLAGWSIRRKLMLLVMIPLIALIVGGGALVTQIGLEYQRAREARVNADAVLPALQTAAALSSEFNDVPRTDEQALRRARANTDRTVAALRLAIEDLRKIDSTTSDVPLLAETASVQLKDLTKARGLVDRVDDPNLSADQVQNAFNPIFDSVVGLVFGLTGDLSRSAPDPDIADSASVVAAMSTAARAAGTERLVYGRTLADPSTMNAARSQELSTLAARQEQALTTAAQSANAEQRTRLLALQNQEGDLRNWRDDQQPLLAAVLTNTVSTDEAAARKQSEGWMTFSTERFNQILNILNRSAVETRGFARDAETEALTRAALVAAAVIITLIVVTTMLAGIARSVTQPLRRLRSGAVDVASVQLPAAVARIEQDGTAADVSLPPVLPADAAAGPETVEVARAVDDLGAEAVRLATAQVRLRRALDEAFVSMSRRSQAMVEKQLGIIDELESQEEDPDQLRNLFRLDHLAARMRRYNDNLLVLAGSAVRTRATAPVKVAELFRAATSEMEQYERVRLQPVSGASIAGTVAGELVHLLAELLDNAAMYSPPSSAIVLSAAFTADGGLQIEVLDAGVGISPGELDRLNARLAQPDAIDTQVPSRMGLFVVARLARRGGFGVMLQSRADASGTVAMVRVPPPLVIGAPGSTGETPAQQPHLVATGQPGTAAGLPQQALQPVASRPPTGPSPALHPVAGEPSYAPSAAAAAAGVRSAVEGDDVDGSPLPRRRKPPRTSTPPGLPPEAIAAASALTPPGGLFTPVTPVSAGDPSEGGRPGEGRDVPAYASGATALGSAYGGRYDDDDEDDPAGTSPRGLPQLGAGSPPAALPTPDAGLPRRTPVAPRPEATSSPFARTDPATGLPLDAGNPAAASSAPGGVPLTGGLTATGSASASALPSGVALPPSAETPRRGTSLPRREPGSQAAQYNPQEPFAAPGGPDKVEANPSVPLLPDGGNGSAPAAWDEALPTELAARAAAAHSYRPADPSAPMIGDDVSVDFNDPTPIFDQISVWFSTDPTTGSVPVQAAHAGHPGQESATVIDLRGSADSAESGAQPAQPAASSRWASLGDQRWLATNARASAAPDTAGTTETGLPKRRPGANLLPSASAAAPGTAVPPHRNPTQAAPLQEVPRVVGGADPDLVRGRLGSYQRGLATARRARTQEPEAPAFDSVGASLFTANREPGDDTGQYSGEQGGDQ